MTPWVPTILFALTYGFGDTVAYPNIRCVGQQQRLSVEFYSLSRDLRSSKIILNRSLIMTALSPS